jgi:hypothetical protein
MEKSKLGQMAARKAKENKQPKKVVTVKKNPITGETITSTTTTVRPQIKSMEELGALAEKTSHDLPKVYFFLVPFFGSDPEGVVLPAKKYAVCRPCYLFTAFSCGLVPDFYRDGTDKCYGV